MKNMFMQNRNQRFSFRKYSIGLASVLIGFCLVGAPRTVYGDEITHNNVEVVTNVEETIGNTEDVINSVEVDSLLTDMGSVKKDQDAEVTLETPISDKNMLIDVPVNEEAAKTVTVEPSVTIPKEDDFGGQGNEDLKREYSVEVPKVDVREESYVKPVSSDEKPVTDLYIPKEESTRNSLFRSGARSTFIGDTYHWKYGNINTDLDRWGYPVRQCTSFVAFRLAETNGFSNVAYLGNGADWGKNAWSRGGYVDAKPAVGAVAWYGAGSFGASDIYGHVAWVAEVNGDEVIIEEYNYNWSYGYNRRSIKASSVTGYIHFKDLEDQPVAPATVQGNSGSLPANGTYRFTEKSFIKSEPRMSATNIAYYDAGMTVNYDKVLEADGYRWISYQSLQGNRRYISVGKLSNIDSKVEIKPVVSSTETSSSSIPSSGSYTFKEKSFIKSEPKISAENLAYYDVGMTVNYDKVLEADGYRWISYLSFQGNRRYIPLEKVMLASPVVTTSGSNSEESRAHSMPSSGTYKFKETSYIRNEPKMSAAIIARYDVGMTVNYDKILKSEGHDWLSYISRSGVRRYIAIN